jgi:F0F1-type ATP synthase membrane subunit c/vacuolar-type H+-ATPase subunit K
MKTRSTPIEFICSNVEIGATTKTNRKNKVMMLADTLAPVIQGNVHIGLAFGGAAIGIGIATAGGVTAMARNPSMFGKILTFMFVGMALAEGWAVIAWLVVR